MSLVSNPRANSASPRIVPARSRPAGLFADHRDDDTVDNGPPPAAPPAPAAAVKQQKAAPGGTAVAVKLEPTSTPLQSLSGLYDSGTGGLESAVGESAAPSAAGGSTSTHALAAAAVKAAGRRDKEAKMASLKQDEQDFVNKYTRAFPAFVFHFDSVEPGPFGAKARDLGARIDKFFSRSVTHVITARPIPTFKDKENAPPAAGRRITIGGTDARTAGGKTAKSAVNPFLDETGQSDVLLKALTFKMKVWDVKKFQSVIHRLLPTDVSPKKARVQSRHKAANAEAAAATLSHLLEDERKNGTRERDQTAPRPDYQYFQRGGFYVLCEDATGEFRTVIAREYERPRGHDFPEWPVLHETFLKPSVSKYAPPPPPPPPAPKVAPAPSASATTDKTAAAAAAGDRPIARLPARLLKGDGAGAPDLRRSVSLSNLGRAASRQLATLDETRHPAAADNDGAYIAASGNSVNVTSATTSAQSGAAAAGTTFDGRERAIAELNRKTVAFHQAPRPSAPSSTASAATPAAPVPAAAAAPAVAAGGSSRAGSVAIGDPSSVRKRKTRAALAAVAQAEAEQQQAQLEAKERAERARRELLGRPQAKGAMAPPPMKKRHSLPANLAAEHGKEKVRLPPREETKKPGYCENCRNKFDDFGAHIKSRRHRRFALNDDHFTDLDRVLGRLDRQIIGRPALLYDRLNLAEEEYDEDDYPSEEYSEEEHSSEEDDEDEDELDDGAVRVKDEPEDYDFPMDDGEGSDGETASS